MDELNEQSLNEFSVLAMILSASASVILSTAATGITKMICGKRDQRLKYIDNLHYKNEESVDKWLSMNLGSMMEAIKRRGTREDYKYAKELYKNIFENTEVVTVKLVHKRDKDGNEEPFIFNAKSKLGKEYTDTGTKIRLVVVKGAFNEKGLLLKTGENKTVESINSYIGRINKIYWRVLGDSEEMIEDRYKNGFKNSEKSLLIPQSDHAKLRFTEGANMTLDEEITLGKEERDINKKLLELLESIDFNSNLYNIKYSKGAEMLREYNYLDRISELARTKQYDYKELKALRENVTELLEGVESDDKNVVKESYEELGKLYFRLNK